MTLLAAAVSAGLLPYQAPIQAVQHVPIEAPIHHLQPVPIQHVPVAHAPVQQIPVQPVQYVPIQEQVHVQKVHVPAPTREVVSIQKTIVKEIEVCTILKKLNCYKK